MFSAQPFRMPRDKQMFVLKARGVWHSSRGGCEALGCQDNPLWLAPLLAEISLQDMSCVVAWPPAFYPLQQGLAPLLSSPQFPEIPYGFLCFKPRHNFPG